MTLWQMGVNDLADAAAELFSDYVGNPCEMTNFRVKEANTRQSA